MTDFVVGNLHEPAMALTASDVPAAFPSLDAALQDALSANRPAAVRCDLLQGGPASSFAIHEFIPTRLGPVIEFRAADGLGQAVLALKDSTGPCVYAAAKIGGGTRWVALSGLAAFYALAKVDRDSQRQGWIAKLKAVKKADWPSELVPARDRLGELSSAALRLLLAWLGPRGSIPIKGINQPAKKFRGAKTDGATLPVFRYPLVEPECYLRVISGHEGWVESINAYDLGAGISVGPIQFNAQGGFVIKLLRDLDVADPVLFADCFSSLEWTTEQGAAHPVLVVGSGPSPIRLVGRKQDNDRNIGYFHCGVPGKTAFADIDAAFRKDLTGRFRDAMVWPHVQELILATSAAWLQPGLDKLATAGFAAIDTKRPDRDLFVLKALLLSCFVRFSASLAPLIKHLKPFDTPREKLDALRPVLLTPGEWSELNRDRRTALADRMKAQRPVAEAVWDTIMRLADGTAAPEMASAAVPPAELIRENARLRELLRGLSLPTGGLFDAASTTSPASMPQTGRELIVLMPRAPAAAAAASPAAVTGPGRSTVPLDSQVASVLSARGASLNLLFDATAHAAFDARAAAAPAAARSASLAYHRVLAKDADLDGLAEDLRALDSVTAAYVKPRTEPAQLNTMAPKTPAAPAPPTQDFTPMQGYLNAAPGGIDARFAWTQSGGKGEGVSIIDVEGGWRLRHEDVGIERGLLGGEMSQELVWVNHGTAVCGVMRGNEDRLGITGICPKAKLGVVSIFSDTDSSSAAIRRAADELRPGDLLLIELHRPGPVDFDGTNGQFGFIAVEWWPDDYDAIRYAVDKGVIVVEAAGNGSQDLDAAIYDERADGFPADWSNPFRRGARDSGAILVGAGAPPSQNFGPDRSRLDFSNYGKAVDAQGWGEEVTTAGYGDLQGGNDQDRWYTMSFSGTSSASPIVVGALACVQGVLRASRAPLLAPASARQLLRATGSPQQAAPGRPASQRIGKRPNLQQMLAQAQVAPPARQNQSEPGMSARRQTTRRQAKRRARKTRR